LLHHPRGTELAQVYDAIPNLFQEGLVKWDMALAVDGTFDHRRISVTRLLAEIKRWGVLPEPRAEALIAELLASLDNALAAVKPPKSVSPGVVDALGWNLRRLQSGGEISRPKR
jgi:hypothetical protein